MSQTAPIFKHQKAWENDKNTFGKENVKITVTLKGAWMHGEILSFKRAGLAQG